MNVRTDVTGSEIESRRPGGKSLKESYEHHDVGHAHVVGLLEERGFSVEEYGIDERDHDADEGIITSDRMDLKVYDGDRTAGFIDVKTKTRPRWMGLFNAGDYEKYVTHATEFGVPAFIVMSLVSDESIEDTFVTDMKEMTPMLSSTHEPVGRFPDGKGMCYVPHEYRHGIGFLYEKMSGYQ